MFYFKTIGTWCCFWKKCFVYNSGCVDVWEPKVLRAAMGAHFRLPIIPSLTWDEIPSHLPKTATIHVADNCRTTTMTEDDHSVTPKKQKKPSDYGWVRGHQHPRKVEYEDGDLSGFEDYDSRKSLETRYYYIDWVARHTGLIIGGETHGLSREALQVAERTGGRRLLIPMVHGVDSLNSAMAASILLFEGRKQLLSLAEKIRIWQRPQPHEIKTLMPLPCNAYIIVM